VTTDMLATAMLNPTTGIPPSLIVLLLGGIGMTIGFLWIRRITSSDADSNRSFFRSRRRRR
jgi:hypothetical protein